MFRKGLVGAAMAVLALGAIAKADDQVVAPAAPTPAAAPAAPAAAAPAAPEGAIMWGLDQIGVGKVLEDLHISITGYGEMGYFYDLTVPHNSAPPRSAPPTFIQFPGDYKNQLMLNQVDLAIQRTVDS